MKTRRKGVIEGEDIKETSKSKHATCKVSSAIGKNSSKLKKVVMGESPTVAEAH